MGDWRTFIAPLADVLVAIWLAGLLGTAVALARRPTPPPRRAWRDLLEARVIAVIAIMAVAFIAGGAIPATVVGMVGAAGYSYWAAANGYLGWPFPRPSHGP